MVLFIVLLEPGACVISSSRGSLGNIFRRGVFSEWQVSCLSGKSASIEFGGGLAIFLGDRVSFVAVLLGEFIKALVSTNLNASDLESIPALIKDCFDVALVHGEMLSVDLGAICTDECTERHITMRGSVVLTIDTESIKLILIHSPVEVGTNICPQSITPETWLGQRRPRAARLGVSCGLRSISRLSFDHFR